MYSEGRTSYRNSKNQFLSIPAEEEIFQDLAKMKSEGYAPTSVIKRCLIIYASGSEGAN